MSVDGKQQSARSFVPHGQMAPPEARTSDVTGVRRWTGLQRGASRLVAPSQNL